MGWFNRTEKNTSLSFVSTDDLLHELKSRQENIIIGWIKYPRPDKFERFVWFAGKATDCLYVAERLKQHIMEFIAKQETK